MEGVSPMHKHSIPSTTEETTRYHRDAETGGVIVPIGVSNSDEEVHIVVDADVVPIIEAARWRLQPSARIAFSAVAYYQGRTTVLHRLITGTAKKGRTVRPRNGNELDYRRANIEYVDRTPHNKGQRRSEVEKTKTIQRATRLSTQPQRRVEPVTQAQPVTPEVDVASPVAPDENLVIRAGSARASVKRKGSGITPTLRRKILDRDAGICFYCGYEAEEVDHIVPYSYGGTDDENNLIASCTICNQIVSNRVFDTLEEKRDWIREQYGPWMEKRYKRMLHRYSVCADCQELYSPKAPGASNLLCAPCYARS